LVERATLTKIVEKDLSWLAGADSINKYLIGAAGVYSLAPLSCHDVLIAWGADSAFSIDSVSSWSALTLFGYKIQDLILVTAVTLSKCTGTYIDCWSAGVT
jgi:hypothetical protein